MMRGVKTLGILLGGVALGLGTQALVADAPDNPYQGIVERNVFNLKPPPRPEDNLPPAAPPPKITLTGITTILGNKRALMKVQEPPRPPQPAKEESYILTEGQRDGEVEVLAIDEQAGSVKVNNHGTVQELTFDKDGSKLPNNPAAIPIPSGMPGAGATPPNANTFRFNPALRTIPPRTLRLPPMPGAQGSRPGGQ